MSTLRAPLLADIHELRVRCTYGGAKNPSVLSITYLRRVEGVVKVSVQVPVRTGPTWQTEVDLTAGEDAANWHKEKTIEHLLIYRHRHLSREVAQRPF